MHKEQDLALLHITAQYVAEVQSGQQPRLSDYLARYPRYADAIADFVAYYHAVEEEVPSTEALPHPMNAVSSTEAPPHPTNAVSSTEAPPAVSSTEALPHPTDAINRVPTIRAINCHSDTFDEMHLDRGQQDKRVEELASTGTMTTLLTTAFGQRLLPSQLAAELDLTVDIILLLEQRAIAPATIPHVLCEQMAMLLQQPSTMVQEYLGSLDQRQSGSTVQKRKPQMKVADYPALYVVDKPSFRAIVETSLQLSTEQRSRWCAMLDAEEA
jgi:hypothetical protein